MNPDTPPLRVVVLISGDGSNLQALIDASRHDLPVDIVGVISNVPAAGGLARAEHAGIPSQVLDHRRFTDRAAFDSALARLIDDHQPGLICLAGFMRILTADFVQRYVGRLLNIHPSLLPAYRGLDTHARALANGEREHGCSVHFVTAALDGGPVVVQARVPVMTTDNPATLAQRVLRREHEIYPLAVRWFASGRLQLTASGVRLDGQPLTLPVIIPPAKETAA